MSLTQKECIPCREGSAPLTESEAKALLEKTPGWVLEENATKISRAYSFKNFRDAFAFVAKVSLLAEKEGHHPDISFGWGYCSLVLQTHAIKALHENDFIMAAKINALS
jgi:4a-hydroxytetrahydrobiopterin dehydratase